MGSAKATATSRGRDGDEWMRPQSAAFTLLAEHVVPRRVALWSGSFIEVFGRLGIGEHATRATLSRMFQRGLLLRHRHGRRVYFSPTQRCREVLEGGRHRIWEVGAVNDDADTPWTITTFTLPEDHQRERHDLRSRLAWAGLGPLRPGVWIGPAEPDSVAAVMTELGLDGRVHVLPVGRAPAADLARVAREAFDLDALAAGYRSFVETWRDALRADVAPVDDALALTIRLTTQWLQLLRRDPRVPVPLLPAGWPAVEAQALFTALHRRALPAATEAAAALFDTVALGEDA